jgi:hypothetical protein
MNTYTTKPKAASNASKLLHPPYAGAIPLVAAAAWVADNTGRTECAALATKFLRLGAH